MQSTHQPDQAFLYSDKTLVINRGRVFAYGDPKDVITKELVSDLYGVDVEVNSLYGDKVRVCVPVKGNRTVRRVAPEIGRAPICGPNR